MIKRKIRYLVVVEKERDEETAFTAYVPNVPGCYTCSDKKDALPRLMKEALEGHLALLKEDGDPIPEPQATIENILPKLRKEDEILLQQGVLDTQVDYDFFYIEVEV